MTEKRAVTVLPELSVAPLHGRRSLQRGNRFRKSWLARRLGFTSTLSVAETVKFTRPPDGGHHRQIAGMVIVGDHA